MRKSYIFLCILLLGLVIFFWVYFPALSRYRELKEQEVTLVKEIAKLDEKIEELIEERHLLQNDLDYLEKVIREELGLVKPGEVIYKLVNVKPEEQPAAEEPAAEDAAPVEAPAEPQPA